MPIPVETKEILTSHLIKQFVQAWSQWTYPAADVCNNVSVVRESFKQVARRLNIDISSPEFASTVKLDGYTNGDTWLAKANVNEIKTKVMESLLDQSLKETILQTVPWCKEGRVHRTKSGIVGRQCASAGTIDEMEQDLTHYLHNGMINKITGEYDESLKANGLKSHRHLTELQRTYQTFLSANRTTGQINELKTLCHKIARIIERWDSLSEPDKDTVLLQMHC